MSHHEATIGPARPLEGTRARTLLASAFLAPLLLAGSAWAHPAPLSYVDLHLERGRLEVALVAHVIDLAHELNVAPPDRLLDAGVAEARRGEMFALVTDRLTLRTPGGGLVPEPIGIEVLAERRAIRLRLRYPIDAVPGSLTVDSALFPYDANHQTFLNVYEAGELRHQSIFDAGRERFEYFTGSRQGTLAVVRKFVAAGIHHIVIGPDHVLFLVGLLLVGGGFWQLLTIVTAFTLAHSVTLSLAALGVLTPPGRLVEPAIALSIVYVGTDNLLVSREGRDVRAWIALAFGLIHGFGFASVLRELELPRQALAWSLFSFNVGVEVGQAAIVVVVAGLLMAIRRRSAPLGRRIAVAGSLVVVAAGTFWFVERVFFEGGMT